MLTLFVRYFKNTEWLGLLLNYMLLLDKRCAGVKFEKILTGNFSLIRSLHAVLTRSIVFFLRLLFYFLI